MSLFEEINFRLTNDEKPSSYFENLRDPEFFAPPFTVLSDLKFVEQSPVHHPEGNVWNHTMLVIDLAAVEKVRATDSRVFMWAALLHDIGKTPATKLRKGKITAYDHDKIGAGMAREFLKAFSTDSSFIGDVVSLVRWHMQILHFEKSGAISEFDADINDIALLGLCDRLGRKNVDVKKERESVMKFLQNAKNKQFTNRG